MSITFKTRIPVDGSIAVPKKVRKQFATKVVTVTVADSQPERSKDIFDEWMKKSPFPADFRSFSRDEIYAGR